MKIIYSFCVFLAICVNVRAQNVQSPCNFSYSVTIIEPEDSPNSHLKFATLDWDFSQFGDAAQINIEVQPIADCWEKLDAKELRPLRVVPVTAQNKKSKLNLGVMEMRAKCLKWRTVIISQDCTVTSDWKFFSFLTK